MKLYQIDNKLIVSEIEKPQCWDGDLIKYNEDLTEWKKQAVEVAESEREKFIEMAINFSGKEDYRRVLIDGISIKPEMTDEFIKQTLSDFKKSIAQPKITNETDIEKNYGTEVSIIELLGHYKTQFLTSEQYMELIINWHEGEVKKLNNNWLAFRQIKPNDNYTILMCNIHKDNEVVIGSFDGLFWKTKDGIYELTHWMPLPKAPISN